MEKKAKAEAKRLRRINRKQAGNVSDQPVAMEGDPDGDPNGDPNGDPESLDGAPAAAAATATDGVSETPAETS